MLDLRPLTKTRKVIALLCGMAAAAAIVVSGFPESPPGIGKLEYLLLLWLASIVIWGVLVLMNDSLARAQKTTQSMSDESQKGQT